MSKYEPLTKFLDARDDAVWEADFSAIENILGMPLPNSAYRFPAWWANQQGKGQSQKAGWQDAGWRTAKLNLEQRTVQFERAQNTKAVRVASGESADNSRVDLWSRASAATGVSDKDALIEAGLKALIARDAALQLVALGGSMPDLELPARERPSL